MKQRRPSRSHGKHKAASGAFAERYAPMPRRLPTAVPGIAQTMPLLQPGFGPPDQKWPTLGLPIRTVRRAFEAQNPDRHN